MASPTSEQFRAIADASTAKPIPVATRDSFLTVSVNYTRPADTTAYAVGDIVGVPIAVPGISRTAGEGVRIERVRLRKTGTNVANASFRIRLFRLLPTVNVADNGVLNNNGVLAIADMAGFLGSFDVTLNEAGVVGAVGPAGLPNAGAGMTFETDPAGSGQIWAIIEARGAYTPASAETFTLTFEGARG